MGSTPSIVGLCGWRAGRVVLLAGLTAGVLSACGGGGGSESLKSVVAPQGNIPPAADFTFAIAPLNAKAPATATFDGAPSRDADGTIATYSWDFGDTTTAIGKSVQHTYTTGADYTVALTVTDNGGATHTWRRTVTIKPTNVAPAAAFTASPQQGTTPLTVSFDAATSTDSDGTVAAYSWDFDDGGTGTGQTIEHTFTIPGTVTQDFDVTLTVTDDDGATSQTMVTVTVDPVIRLSGTIQILGTSAVDGDVNDTNATRLPNNSFDTAQALSNPVTLGGYANVKNAGANGANLSGDPSDFYRISLAGGESLVLTIGESDAVANDLDLFLYDSGRNLVDSSVGTDNTEIISTLTGGTYFVEVRAATGASNYNLSIGVQATQASKSLSLHSEFVPGELLVIPTSAGASVVTALKQAPGIQTLHAPDAQQLRGPMLVRLSDVSAAAATFGLQSARLNAIADPKLRERQATLEAVKAMRKRSDVIAAEPNYIRHALAVPNDTFYNLQWHYRDIALPQAWDNTTGSTAVTVAVIDTGILHQHPDFTCDDRAQLDGYDFISTATRANDGDGRDADSEDAGDQAFGGAGSFHGTHVAGTVGACSNNGRGVAGVNWNVRVMPLRVLGIGGGTSDDIIAALLYAARLPNAANVLPSRKADIINMSLGGGSNSSVEQATIAQVRAQGLIVIAAAGNESTSTPSYPAAYDGVVSVSATTIARTLAPYSNFGNTIDVAAPGGNNQTDLNGDGKPDGVLSTRGDDSSGNVRYIYDLLNGTSMAAPHVAGVAALMKAIDPALTPLDFDRELAAGRLTDDIGAAGRDNSFGYGIINANKAVLRAKELANGGGAVNSFLFSTPSTISFGALGTQQTITVQNAGTAAASITNVTSDQPWLTVTAGTVDANGLGTYTVTVDRGTLAEGAYSGTLSFTGTSNSFDVQVLMQVATFSATANAGIQYVLAVDPDTNATLFVTQVAANNGSYVYSLDGILKNQSYVIVSGSDLNNDGFICDAGESCGIYPTIDDPTPVVVATDSIGNLNFVSGFRTNLTSAASVESTGGRGFAIRVDGKSNPPTKQVAKP